MKIKLFTHTDLDGVGCAIALKSLFGEGHEVNAYYCDYEKVNQKVTNFIENKTEEKLEDYDYIFITDISVNEEVAEKLQAVEDSDMGPFVQLLDHHGTAEWLNKYDWAHVNSQLRGRPNHKSSGTSLILDFFEYQRPGFGITPSPALRNFLEQVRRYDTWEWDTIYDDEGPKDLNDLLYLIGRKDFLEGRLRSIKEDDGITLSETEHVLLTQRKKQIKEYIDKKEKQLHTILIGANEEDEDIYAGVVFAESHVSELGNEICKRHPELEYVVIFDVGAKKMSLRTVKDINVSEIAKRLGGGGHPKASGAPINVDTIHHFISEQGL